MDQYADDENSEEEILVAQNKVIPLDLITREQLYDAVVEVKEGSIAAVSNIANRRKNEPLPIISSEAVSIKVPVTINGYEIKMLLDTGAGKNFLSKETCKKRGFETKTLMTPISVNTALGKVKDHITDVLFNPLRSHLNQKVGKHRL